LPTDRRSSSVIPEVNNAESAPPWGTEVNLSR
jgi:hypothetical protein